MLSRPAEAALHLKADGKHGRGASISTRLIESGAASGSVEYTAEELEVFKNDQEALKREIRNVQSKKSIMKSKADFSEEDERWIQLLGAEDMLKGMRVGGGTVKTVVVDKTGEQLKAELGDKDIDSLKAADAKALLKKLLEAASGKVETEEPTAE